MGDTWRDGRITGEILYPSDIRDIVLRSVGVKQYFTEIFQSLESVVFCFEMGKDNKTVPSFQRVFMAGGTYDPRNL